MVLLTIAIYTTGNLVLLLVCLYLVSRPAELRSLLPARHHVAYENSTLLFGAFSAVVVLHAPWLSPLILILIASLHRASLVTDLQHSANTDAKTGLLNSRGWQVMARQQLSQAESAGTRVRGAADRPRPLQAGQRHPRPPGRRRGAQGGGRHPGARAARL